MGGHHADFITVRPEQIDVGIERALEGICRYADARPSRVCALSSDGQRVLDTYGWSADPGIAIMAAAKGLPIDGFGPIREMLARGEPLVVRKRSGWTPEIAELLALFDGDGFRPLIQVPMFRGQRLIGALAIAGVPGQESTWPDSILLRLQFAAQVIQSAIEREIGGAFAAWGIPPSVVQYPGIALGASPRGVGLGLSISRSLVAATGGSLRFRSRQGRGTLFHVVLPVET